MEEAQRRVTRWIVNGDVNAILDLSALGLTELPELPQTLTDLYCSDNQLTVLPELPQTLTELFCLHNELTVLPELPQTLTLLGCDNNELRVLPELPQSFTKLYCCNNQLTELPELPQTLISFSCKDNSNMVHICGANCFCSKFNLNYPIITVEQLEEHRRELVRAMEPFLPERYLASEVASYLNPALSIVKILN